MPRDGSFWRNLTIIALLHVVFATAVVLWSASARKPLGSGIVWLERGVAQAAPAVSAQLQMKETEAEEDAASEQTEDRPATKDAVSDDSRSASTPKPIPKKAKPPPPAKSSKITPKKITKPSPKVVAKQEEHSKNSAEASGSGNRASSAGNASQFSWYGNMLHDRFFSSWDQPTSVVATGAKMSVLVRLRIEKDGRVSSFALVRPSGNVVVDESVAAVAKRVTQVDPLPAGLGNGGHYEVNINFELNAD